MVLGKVKLKSLKHASKTKCCELSQPGIKGSCVKSKQRIFISHSFGDDGTAMATEGLDQ